MKGLFIPEITVEMFRNGCLESIEALMAEGEIYDIDYELKQKKGKIKWINAEQQVTITTYDEEHEEHLIKTMTVEEMLDTYTNEGCPTIYSNPECKGPVWIPCSERLPKQGQEVICQCRASIITVLRLDANGDWYKDAEHCYMSGFVIAWMPLPAPYKE